MFLVFASSVSSLNTWPLKHNNSIAKNHFHDDRRSHRSIGYKQCWILTCPTVNLREESHVEILWDTWSSVYGSGDWIWFMQTFRLPNPHHSRRLIQHMIQPLIHFPNSTRLFKAPIINMTINQSLYKTINGLYYLLWYINGRRNLVGQY